MRLRASADSCLFWEVKLPTRIDFIGIVRYNEICMLTRAVEAFLGYFQDVKGRSKSTIKSYRADLGDYIAWVDSNCKKTGELIGDAVIKITAESLSEYISWLKLTCEVRQATVARRYASLVAFYSYLVSMHMRSDNPASALKHEKRSAIKLEYLTNDEQEKLYLSLTLDSFLRSRDASIFRILLECGAKLSEVAKLKVADIHEIEGESELELRLNRGHKTVILKLNSDTSSTLRKYLSFRFKMVGLDSVESHLFINRRGRALNLRSIDRRLELCAQDVGISAHKVNANVLRHTCAIKLVERGMLRSDLAHILGLSSNTSPILGVYYSEVKIKKV